MEPTLSTTFLTYLNTECGVVSVMLGISCCFLTFLWWLERRDRRAAWKTRNEDLEKMLQVMNDNKLVLEAMKSLLSR